MDNIDKFLCLLVNNGYTRYRNFNQLEDCLAAIGGTPEDDWFLISILVTRGDIINGPFDTHFLTKRAIEKYKNKCITCGEVHKTKRALYECCDKINDV